MTSFAEQAVYELPISSADDRKDSIALALQSLFYKLQVGHTAASTTRLTQSFGWDSAESFLQHDVQELNRVLCDKLEEKMRGTPVEGTMQTLFEGHTTTYIECLEVPYASSRKESFLDLQLDVRGCRDVVSSFKRFVEEEQLAGENAYEAEGFGLQRARKGVRFVSLPPVLQLQLKRFEFDPAHGCMQKLNDRYEFPLELDLCQFIHASPGEPPPPEARYALHSVLVHSGGASGGHYYAYIRPTCAGSDWFCFDDDRVTRADVACAVEGNFGDSGLDSAVDYPPRGPAASGSFVRDGRFSSAYMLVYVRVGDVPRVLCSQGADEIPEQVRLRLETEASDEARVKREQDEAHLYTAIRVATDRDVTERVNSNSQGAAFDLVDWDMLPSLRVAKHETFSQFKKLAAAKWGVPVELQRWWCWNTRQNGTCRPFRPILADEDDTTIGAVKPVSWSSFAGVPLYLETLRNPCRTDFKFAEHALLFFKVRSRSASRRGMTC